MRLLRGRIEAKRDADFRQHSLQAFCIYRLVAEKSLAQGEERHSAIHRTRIYVDVTHTSG